MRERCLSTRMENKIRDAGEMSRMENKKRDERDVCQSTRRNAHTPNNSQP